MGARGVNRASKGDSGPGQSRDAALIGAVTASLPHTVVVAFDRDLRFRMAYGEALGLNGWSGQDMQGKTPRELLSEGQANVLEPLFRAALDGQRSSVEAGWLDEDRVLLTYVAPIIGGHDLAGVAISVDITDRKRSEQETRRLAAIVEQSDDAIQATNRKGGITAWNRGAERLYGPSASEALGQHVSALAPPDQREATLLRVAAGETARYETQRCRKDGTLVEVSVTSSPIRDASGRITGTSAIARDIGGRKRLERQLRNLANHDPLTGLLNRRAFDAELSRSVALAGRLSIHAALLVLDVDPFKYVNDT